MPYPGINTWMVGCRINQLVALRHIKTNQKQWIQDLKRTNPQRCPLLLKRVKKQDLVWNEKINWSLWHFSVLHCGWLSHDHTLPTVKAHPGMDGLVWVDNWGLLTVVSLAFRSSRHCSQSLVSALSSRICWIRKNLSDPSQVSYSQETIIHNQSEGESDITSFSWSRYTLTSCGRS